MLPICADYSLAYPEPDLQMTGHRFHVPQVMSEGSGSGYLGGLSIRI